VFRLNLDIFDIVSLFFSWYIKPVISDQGVYLYSQLFVFLILVLLIKLSLLLYYNFIDPILYCISSIKITSLFSIFFGLKFIIFISLLIFCRGGIPRYRYDFLTKLGWIKTLSLVLAVFIINLLLSYL